jgi:hypothetical protein
MKHFGRELRMECLKLAVGFGNAHKLSREKVIETAKRFEEYIDTDPELDQAGEQDEADRMD